MVRPFPSPYSHPITVGTFEYINHARFHRVAFSQSTHKTYTPPLGAMQLSKGAWLFAIIPALFTPYAQCEDDVQTYGTTQVTLYSASHTCIGTHTMRKITGPPVNNKTTVYGKCFVASEFSSLILHDTSPAMVTDCNIVWYQNESCAELDGGGAFTNGGHCQDTRISEPGYPTTGSKSFQLQC